MVPRLDKEWPSLEELARAALHPIAPEYVRRTLTSSTADRLDPRDVPATFDRFILVDSAGSGKTALFADVVSQAARTFLANPDTEVCPILIRGADLANALQKGDGAIPVNCGKTLARSALDDFLSSGRASFWLDGWDEIPRAEIENPELWALIASSKRAAIATRPPVHQSLLDWPQLAFVPLNEQEFGQIVVRLVSSKEIAAKFTELVIQRYDVWDMARSPLLLTMMVKIFNDHGTLSINPTTTLSIAIHSLLNEWDAKRGSVNDLRRVDRLDYLSHIACRMYALNQHEMYYSEIIRFIRQINETNYCAEDVLRDVLTVGLFYQDGDGRFAFSHKTLMHYLVAMRFRSEPAGLAALLRRNDSGWRELVQYVGALASSVDGLVEAFLEFDWISQAAFTISSGRVLNTALERRIADRVENQLGARFVRKAAAHWLGKDQDERIASLLARKRAERERYKELLDRVLTPNARGRLFEDFIASFFIGPFRLINRNVGTLHGEIDLVFEVVATGPFWSDLGGQVLVECKNEAQVAETKQVNHFMQKVNNVQNVRVSFFAARSGIGRHARDAMRIQAANPTRALVIPICGDQLCRELDTPFEREDFFVRVISDAKLMRR